MKFILLRVLLVSFAAGAIAVVPAEAQENRNFELWNQNSVSGKIGAKSTLVLCEKIHFNTVSSEITLKYGEISYRRSVEKWFSWSGGLRFTALRREYGWLNEQRPMISFSFLPASERLKINFGSRFEYLMYKNQNSYFRNLEKIEVESNPFTSLGLSVFSMGEVFTRLNRDNFHIFRWYAGMNMFTHLKFIRMKAFYALQYLKNGESVWVPTDVVGINVNISI